MLCEKVAFNELAHLVSELLSISYKGQENILFSSGDDSVEPYLASELPLVFFRA